MSYIFDLSDNKNRHFGLLCIHVMQYVHFTFFSIRCCVHSFHTYTPERVQRQSLEFIMNISTMNIQVCLMRTENGLKGVRTPSV